MLFDQHLACALPGVKANDKVIVQIEVATRSDCIELFATSSPAPILALSPVRPAAGRRAREHRIPGRPKEAGCGCGHSVGISDQYYPEGKRTGIAGTSVGRQAFQKHSHL